MLSLKLKQQPIPIIHTITMDMGMVMDTMVMDTMDTVMVMDIMDMVMETMDIIMAREMLKLNLVMVTMDTMAMGMDMVMAMATMAIMDNDSSRFQLRVEDFQTLVWDNRTANLWITLNILQNKAKFLDSLTNAVLIHLF